MTELSILDAGKQLRAGTTTSVNKLTFAERSPIQSSTATGKRTKIVTDEVARP